MKEYDELAEENEQLKMKNANLIKISAMIQVRNDKLSKENKELKQELLETIDASSDNRPNKKGFMGNGRFA